VTAADDELLRLWNSAGKKVAEYAYKGGPCRCVRPAHTAASTCSCAAFCLQRVAGLALLVMAC
jgi:hypothetical protein